MGAEASGARRTPPADLLPRWLQRTAAYCAAALLVAGVLWLVVALLSRVALLTVALGAALLATALLAPLQRRLHRLGLPAGLAALAGTLLLVSAPLGVALLLYARVTARLSDLGQAVTQGVDRVRAWLVGGPLHLDPAQVDGLRDSVVERVQSALPGAVTSTTLALQGIGVAFFVAFAVFFLLKDGARMWGSAVSGVPTGARARVDAGGRAAWEALGGYVRGVVVIAMLDALFIGTALLLLGVPLWLSLTLLTFLAAFVPYLGATVAGVVAVLVTLVTQGTQDALVVLVVVFVVQQVEGNVLQPLVMQRALRLHPLVVLSSVTAGGLLFGVAGAASAVPLVAAVTRATGAVRAAPAAEQPPESEPRPEPGPARPVPREAADARHGQPVSTSASGRDMR